MQLKILVTTSSIMDTWEPLVALTSCLLKENQLVGVMGPGDLSLPEHENLQLFSTLGQAKEFEPNVVLPLDVQAAGAMFNYWENCKAHSLYKDRLGLALNQLRSFGLSLLASAGVPTVNHMVISNQNDLLRFEAKRQSEPGDWDMFYDHPLAMAPNEQGNLAVQKAEGVELSFCFLVSDSKAVKGEEDEAPAYFPPIAFAQLKGLLRKGGRKDYRGLVGQFVSSPAALSLSRKVKAACQSIGLKGLVFLNLVYVEGQPLATRLHSTSPPGFLSLLLYSGILTGPLHEMLLGLLKDRRFPLGHSEGMHWSLMVGNPSYASSEPLDWSSLPEVVGSPRLPVPSYEAAYLTMGPEKNIPEGVWDICPMAEVKLDLEAEEAGFKQLLSDLGLTKEV